MPRQNIILVRHGDCEIEYNGHDAGLTSKGQMQMLGLGESLNAFLRPSTLVLESPLKRSIESTDCVLEALSHIDIKRHKMLSLAQDSKYESIMSAIKSHKGDVLVMTHTPLLQNVYEEIMESKYPFTFLPQGTYLHFQSLNAVNNSAGVADSGYLFMDTGMPS